jgi:Cof subfamily protein (haloacid dehalogenase superfamily)
MNSDFNNIKVVISDLDGTLLNKKHQISDFTKDVFRQLHKEKFLLIVATGRHHLDALAVIDKLGVPVYLVSSNGARVHSPEKEELFAFDMKSEMVKLALSVDIDPEITVVLYKEKVWQTNRLSEKLNSFQIDFKYLPELVDYKTLEDFRAIKMFFSHENHEKLVMIKDAVLANQSNELHHAFSLPTCLEFMDKSIDKSVGIQKVLEREGFLFSEAISFGDGFNDVQMLSATAKALIMENAPSSLKMALPNLEVISSNDNDGVAKYLAEKFIKNTVEVLL